MPISPAIALEHHVDSGRRWATVENHPAALEAAFGRNMHAVVLHDAELAGKIFQTLTEPVSAISASLLMHAVSGCHAVA